MRRASQIQPEELSYVWRERIPHGRITLIAGRPGEGKSTLTTQIAADVSHEVPVILSNHEDNHGEDVVPRLLAAGAAMPRVYIPDEPYQFPRDVERLERRIRRTGVQLIVCDAAAQHFDVSMYNSQAVRKALTPLKAMLERTGCGCIFVDHLTKNRRARTPLEALGGPGSGLPAAARFVYVFGTNPKNPDERVLAPVKVNNAKMGSSAAFELETAELRLAPKGSKKLTLLVGRLALVDDDSSCTAEDVVSHKGQPGQSARSGADDVTKRAIAAEWLTGLLMHGPKPVTDVEKEGVAAGFSWGTVRRAADLIPVDKHRQGGRHGKSLWSLPDDHPVLKIAAQMAAVGGDDEDASDLDEEFAELLAEEADDV